MYGHIMRYKMSYNFSIIKIRSMQYTFKFFRLKNTIIKVNFNNKKKQKKAHIIFCGTNCVHTNVSMGKHV